MIVSRISVLCVALSMLSMSAAHAASFPVKPIRIVTSEPGSGNDFVARLLARQLTETLKQEVIVDNRGILAAEIVAKANADGYTLLTYGSPMWPAPFLHESVAYDPVRNFAPITLAASSPNIVVIHPSLTVSSIKDLIQMAKSKPGALNYASASTGSSSHLAGELFKSMAQVDIVRIPYKGTGPAMTAMIGGQVQLMFCIAASAVPQIKSGKLKALAITSAKPSPLMPDLPTVAASGLPGYEAVSIQGVFAPGGTPVAVVGLLNAEMVKAVNRTDIKGRLFNQGVESVGSSPQAFQGTVKAEMTKLGKLIRDNNIRAD